MSAARTIRRIGFRKWYERELLQSHAHLVLLLLATVGLLTSLEIYDRALPLLDQLQVLASAVASAFVGYFGLRRYLYLLKHAEFVADQANCPACDTYARFELLQEHDEPARLRVRCRACGHPWEIRL
jgi:hypothetical protein